MSKLLQKKEETNPFTFMRRVTEELDRAFGFRPDVLAEQTLYPRMWSPAIEIFERDNRFIVRAELPGLEKEDVKIHVTHDELTIEGERKLENKEEEAGFYRTERIYGNFYRRIAVPEHVKTEDAVASFRNGVLEIDMPSIPIPELKKRAVEIKS